jgi:hypothetical protein
MKARALLGDLKWKIKRGWSPLQKVAHCESIDCAWAFYDDINGYWRVIVDTKGIAYTEWYQWL